MSSESDSDSDMSISDIRSSFKNKKGVYSTQNHAKVLEERRD